MNCDIVRLAAFLLLFIGQALADDCPTCDGTKVTGAGPIKEVCEQCRGTGEFDLRKAVVRIELAKALGSGVLVRRDLVLTAQHVIDEGGEVKVVFEGEEPLVATVAGQDETWDLAALRIKEVAVTPVAVAVGRPRRGDRLTIAGHGGQGQGYRELAGRCTGIWLIPAGSSRPDLVEVDVWARLGDSGGAMVDGSSRLAGIISARGNGTVDTHGACAARIKTFLESLED